MDMVNDLVADDVKAGEWMEMTPGERVRICVESAAVGGRYTVLEAEVEAGNGVPMHVHRDEEEHFIVLEGVLRMARGSERFDLAAGGSVTVPKGVAHAWCNLGTKPARILGILSPGGIDELFRAMGRRKSDADVAPVLERFGTVIVGPAMYEGVYSLVSPKT